MLDATRYQTGTHSTNGDIMSDQTSTSDAENSSNDETPMVPHELTPEQLSDDPVAGDPEATGAADGSFETSPDETSPDETSV